MTGGRPEIGADPTTGPAPDTPTTRMPSDTPTPRTSPTTGPATWLTPRGPHGRAPRLTWLLLGVLVLAQIGYPLTGGSTRATLTVATVVLGYLLSVSHALLTRGPRTALALVAVATGGGFAIEALGVATGFPFGSYEYAGTLGPKLAGVPLVIPLAWTWMAWPAWLAATRLVRPGVRRVALAAVGLATWDLFLDPQMVAEGYWRWRDATPALPGLPDIPVSNYLGWLLFGVLMMALLGPLSASTASRTGPADHPMYALYLWTYLSSVLAHAVFFGLTASALWGAAGMAVTAVPLAVTLARGRRSARPPVGTGQPDPQPVDVHG